MAQLVKADTKEIVDVPDDQAQALFQSGQYGALPGSSFTVENKYGQLQSVKAEELDDVLAAGHRIVTPPKPKVEAPPSGAPTPEELAAKQQEDKLQDEYGGAGGATMASILGAGRGLTFGLSDLAEIKGIEALYGKDVAEETRKNLEGYKEANPWASGIGEAVGALAPAVVTGGGSAAASGVATGAREAGTLAKVGTAVLKYSPAGLVDLAAQATERKVAGLAAKVLVGDAAESTLAKLVVKGVEKGAGGAVYGALGGIANETSEDILGDKEITGEKLAAAGLHGAMFGSLVGAGLGTALPALSTGARWALEKSSPAARRASDALTLKAIGGETKAMERIVGKGEGVAAELRASGAIRAGDTLETIAPRLRTMADEASTKHIERLVALEGRGAKGPLAEELVKDLRKGVEGRFDVQSALDKPALTAFDDVAAKIVRSADEEGRVGLSTLRDVRQWIDGHINWRVETDRAKNEALKDARSRLEASIESTGDAEAKRLDMGKEWLDGYKADKLRFQRLVTAADGAEKAASAASRRSEVSLSEKAEVALGIVHGITSGNPLAAAAGVGMAAASKLARERGASTGAVALDKIATFMSIQKTVQNVDSRIARGIDGFLEGKATEHKAASFGSAKARDEAFSAAERHVKLASASPVQTAEAMQKALGGAPTHARGIAQKASAVVGRGVVFLAAKLPTSAPMKSITPQFDRVKDLSPEEKDKFLRYVKAVDDPLSVLDDMSRGRLTREGVESLREVYPELYATLQQQAIEKCADTKHPLDYNQKIQLGLLLGIPTDSTLDPAFMRRMQQIHQDNSGKQGAPGGGTPPAVKRPLKDIGKTAQLGGRRSQ